MMLQNESLFLFFWLIFTCEKCHSFSAQSWKLSTIQIISSRDVSNNFFWFPDHLNSNPNFHGKKRSLLNDNVHRRVNGLKMGGYYSEPTDGGRKVEFGHNVFGLPCRERHINLTLQSESDISLDDNEVISFIVLDPVGRRRSDVAKKEDEATTCRLAQYLIARRSEFVLDKRVLILGSSSWISLLVTRLGASNVMVWDREIYKTRLRLLEHADKVVNKRHPRQKCVLNTFVDGEMLLKKEIETERVFDEYMDVDLIIFAAKVTPEADVYIHDFVRRTDAKVLIDQNLTELFQYHTRVNEGVDVHLW